MISEIPAPEASRHGSSQHTDSLSRTVSSSKSFPLGSLATVFYCISGNSNNNECSRQWLMIMPIMPTQRWGPLKTLNKIWRDFESHPHLSMPQLLKADGQCAGPFPGWPRVHLHLTAPSRPGVLLAIIELEGKAVGTFDL